MKSSKTIFVFSAAALGVVLAGCSQVTSAVSDTREADVRAIHEMEDGWAKVWASKNAAAAATFTASYYADDASLLYPDAPMITGLPGITAAFKDMLQDPNIGYQGGPSKVEVSKSGDLAYSYGTGVITMTDPNSKKPVSLKGKYVEVYRKQADGRWKNVADIYNGDGPPTPVK